ncbi:MAG TPA: hypothetical protein PL124_10210 [Candidatus Cloacimonadota bacterium]|nr:hypothetical protein [Candidatus Cloacimonadota bacterium]
MILLATDDIDIRQKDLMSGQKRGIDIIEDVTKRLIDKGVRNLTPYNLLELELLGAEYIAVAETPWHKKSNDPAQRQAIEEFISTFAADDIDYKPSNVATQTVGRRAGVTPVPLETGRANQELLDTHILPIMDNLKAKLAQDKTDYNTDYVKALTPKEREQLSSWINRTATQLTDTKYNAREWGVMQRDYALLNYKNRTNLDTYMDLIFPYQFWFTRNARNWAMKSLSKPGLIAQVVRREEMMRKNGKGLGKYPKRLQGKMRLPWAFGEDWMGDAIYFNPFKNLFPPNNLMSVFDNLNQYSASVNPIYVLKEQVSNHEITQEEMDEALNKKSGKIWDKALKIAAEQNREELSNPITMASMMLSPSMILSEAFGTKPKDNLPITKTGIAVRSFGKRVGGVLEPVSDILAKALEAPERLLRGNNFSYYGRWGDYIIKRAIASMVADHSASYEEGIIAMATMKGTTYEEATRRVEAELSMKLPGSSLANTLADQAWTNIPQALITTMFPTGLYPKGEMDLMGLTEQMQAAWDEYGKGNPFPIDDLLQKHPELLVKSGINDEPELLMKKLLINNIREKYDALDSINKGIIKQQLGDAFVESLLSGKIDYDNITKEDLLIWTDAFGEQLPEGEQIPVTSKLPGVETFTDDQVAEISGYLDIREQRYPNHAWLQQNYAAITDPIEKKKYLAKFPELTHYWDWNKEYKHAHPIIDQWSAYYGNAGTAYQDPYFGLNKNIIQGYLDKKAELFPNITWQQEVYFNLITDEEKYAFLDANPDLAKAWDWDAKMEASNPNIKMYKQLREAQFAMYQSQPETETGEEHTPAEQSRRLSLLGLHPYVVQELLIYKANKTPYSSGTKSVLERLYVAMGKPTETLEEFINSLY